MVEINDENFNEKVIDFQNKTKIPFILYFYSDKCKYCYLAENILNLLLKKFKKKIFIYKINTKNTIIIDKYNIKGSPTILVFDEELHLIEKLVGSDIDFNKIDNILVNYIKEEIVFFKFLKLF